MWIDPQAQKVFTLHSEIRAAFPSFSFPAEMSEDDLAFAGLAPVMPTEPPDHDPATHQAVPAAPVLQDGIWLQQWTLEPGPTQFERDQARYTKRAAVKDELLAYMAADNMSRVRAQDWTVADLTGLVADPSVKAALDFMGTLSFELAAQAIASATTPLLTPEIRADWVARLQAHFYLEG